ncbi:hypothetical protein [Oryzobacter telluris]|uniref:hypothetical protein n=1 Tax=Oryzobacter telluris TaxID=3149179 RepID=UPI00370DCCAD
MRTAFAHEARLVLDEDGDERAPGGAVTLALCGSWEHPGPCPLAPHHTTSRPDDDALVVRVVFACAPADEDTARELLAEALDAGELMGPDGVRTRWRLLHQGADDLRPDEEDQAARLVAEP